MFLQSWDYNVGFLPPAWLPLPLGHSVFPLIEGFFKYAKWTGLQLTSYSSSIIAQHLGQSPGDGKGRFKSILVKADKEIGFSCFGVIIQLYVGMFTSWLAGTTTVIGLSKERQMWMCLTPGWGCRLKIPGRKGCLIPAENLDTEKGVSPFPWHDPVLLFSQVLCFVVLLRNLNGTYPVCD